MVFVIHKTLSLSTIHMALCIYPRFLAIRWLAAWTLTFASLRYEDSLRKTTSFNAFRKSFLANVHRMGFNMAGTKLRNTSRRCTQSGSWKSIDSVCSSSTVRKYGDQQPAKIINVINKTLRPRHSWRCGRKRCRRSLFNLRSVWWRLNEI